ncbi:MAG: RICIN domain-containing protein, partial [Actinomyces sp.]|nr:RICIN domain-containing protein [Actinomyces sp.]
YTPRNQYYNPHSGKCLTLDGDHYTNGNRLTVWDCHGGASQKWSKPQ